MSQRNKKYDNVHHWILRHWGKATKCEMPNCSFKKPKRYEWALKHGFTYKKDITSFWQLCPSCHRKYDYTDEQRKKVGDATRRRIVSEETRKKMSLAKSGVPFSKAARRSMSIARKKWWERKKAIG